MQPLLSAMMVISVAEGFTSIPEKRRDSQIASSADEQNAMYFASQVEVVRTLCLLDLQNTAPPSIRNKSTVVNLRVSKQPLQSESQ